jgi:hypothetical protein
MFKIPKPEYTAEFKELAVKRVRDGQGYAAVARDLGRSLQLASVRFPTQRSLHRDQRPSLVGRKRHLKFFGSRRSNSKHRLALGQIASGRCGLRSGQ